MKKYIIPIIFCIYLIALPAIIDRSIHVCIKFGTYIGRYIYPYFHPNSSKPSSKGESYESDS